MFVIDWKVDDEHAFSAPARELDPVGAAFTAYAIGDADCDLVQATFNMQGTTTAAGNPAVNIIPPVTGTY